MSKNIATINEEIRQIAAACEGLTASIRQAKHAGNDGGFRKYVAIRERFFLRVERLARQRERLLREDFIRART